MAFLTKYANIIVTDVANANSVVATTLGGTLTTAAQPNVTSVGTLTGLTMGGNIDMGNNTIANLGAPVTDNDVATKGYVDNIAQGLDVKGSVVAATAIALPGYAYNNGTSGVGATITASTNIALPPIDGYTAAQGDRILVKDETAGNAAYNGIYVVTTVGVDGLTPFTLTRAADFDGTPAAEIPGAFTFVERGSTLADTGWVCTTNAPVTVGSTPIAFSQFSGAGSYTAGSGLTLTGTVFSVNVAQPTITSVGTLTALSVDGGNITLANGSYVGNGSGLTDLAGANVTGQVGNALVAGTVYTNAQPNITSVGTLTTLAVTGAVGAGSADIGNIDIGNADANDQHDAIFHTATDTALNIRSGNGGGGMYLYEFGSDGNGTGAGQISVLADSVEIYSAWDSNANLATRWAFANTGAITFPDATVQNTAWTGTVSTLENGNSNVVVAANGNVSISVGGTADVVVVDTTSNVTVAGNVVVGSGSGGNITGANVISANTVSATSLTGTLTTAAQPTITSVGTLSGLSVSGSGNVLAVTGNTVLTGDLIVTGNSNITGNINSISGNSGQFFGDATGNGALYAGISTGFTPLPDTILQMTGSANTYTQVNLQNINTGNRSSADYVITADNGDDENMYIAVGMAGSTYDGSAITNGLANVLSPNDGWVYVQGANTGTSGGGNLVLGTTTSTKVVKIVSGGQNTDSVVATFNAAGSNTSVQVSGGITATGNITATNIGNITPVNLSGNASQVLLGNGTFGAVPATAGVTSLTGGGGITVDAATGAVTLGSTATDAATANAIVARDADGSFSANVITATLSGAATTAGTVTTAAQPNITSVGTLSGLSVSGSGNVLAVTGNTVLTGDLIVAGDGNVSLGNVANVHIGGGNSGEFLQTDGAGTLSWAAISSTSLTNGNSNVIVAANGNITLSAGGTANLLTISSGSNAAIVTGNLSVSGTIYGNISGNISGNIVVPGANTQVLFNDSGNAGASANLTFNGTTLAVIGAITASTTVTATGNVSGGNLTTTGAVTAGTTITATGNISGGNIATSGVLSAGGALVVNTTVVSGATHTVGSSDQVLAFSNTGAVAVTLPTPSAGRYLVFKDVAGSARSTNAITITVANTGSETIDGATSFQIADAYNGITLIAISSTQWILL